MRSTQHSSHRRRQFVITVATLIAMLVNLFPAMVPGGEMPAASAHNLDASAVYIFFDPETQAMLDARIAGGWTAGTPLILSTDELGLIIKAVPDNGTTTGVGGYTTFYVPNGVQVVDAAFVMPDGSGNYVRVATRGQAAMPAVGAGGDSTVSLVGYSRGPNALGITSDMVANGTSAYNGIVFGANTNLGTTAGVYGDTGIFYSTDPSTALGTYTGGTIKNNSGDIVGLRTYLGTPMNEWDAWQMAGFGIAGTTNPNYPTSPIIDSNGRGYAPWGLANAVAGPESGYAWEFDYPAFLTCNGGSKVPNAACINTATQNMGPWQRIQYPGSQISDDPPGARPAVQPYTRGADGSSVGHDFDLNNDGALDNPLPLTTGQSDGTPNALRWAYGQLTYNRPEFAWVKIKVADPGGVVNATGCPLLYLDTFGGDAGGDSGGKDHIWRYYDPNSILNNLCLSVGKPGSKDIVKVGDIFQYDVKVYNLSNFDMHDVVVTDLLPSGVQFISTVPAQNSGPNPLVWNVGTLPIGEGFLATLTVKATSSGVLENKITVTAKDPGDTLITATGIEKTVSGSVPLLAPTKSASPTSIAPGGTVQYTIDIRNVGSGPSGSPTLITEYLPAGFTYLSVNSVTVNGASYSATVGGTASAPTFSVPTGINAGSKLLLTFTAQSSATINPGPYCNSYAYTQNGIRQTTGSLACVSVGGNGVSDTVWRDWNGDGVQDPGEEGIAGVQVCATPSGGGASICSTTDANGNYLINGLVDGTYNVAIASPPANYTQTYDLDGTGTANTTSVTLSGDVIRTDVDFGYQPAGGGAIGDLLFEDKGNDGAFTSGTDSPITDTVTVWLYEDSNGDGAIDPINDTQIFTTTTNASGIYSFSGLDPNLSYIVQVDEGDPQLAAYFSPNAFANSTGTLQSVSPADFLRTDGDNTVNNYKGADFGYFEQVPSSIGDEVCIDSNNDGLCAGETLLPGVTVQLYKDGSPFKTTTTNITGAYTFDGLGPGNYTVIVDVADTDIPGGYFPSTNNIAVTLAVGENRTDVDFPFVQLISKQVDSTKADPGDSLTYTITANYPGSQLLTNVVVTDAIPASTKYVADSDTPEATVTPADNNTATLISWNLGSNVAGSDGSTAGAVTCSVSTSIIATKDTWINSSSTGTNWGNDAQFDIDSDLISHGLVYFPVNGTTLPTGATFTSAQARFTVESSQNANRTFQIRELTYGPWTEGTGDNTACASAGNGATWAAPNCTDSWNGSGGNFAAAAPYGASLGQISPAVDETAYSVDVTSVVGNWAAGGANYGLVMLANGAVTGTVRIHSRTGTAGKEPTLVVNYTYPSTVGCSAEGLSIWAPNGDAEYKLFDGANFDTLASAAPTDPARYLTMAGASSPVTVTKFLVGVDNSNDISVQRWDGAAWNYETFNVLENNVSSKILWGADVDFEQQSGDAILVWNNRSNSRIAYRAWDGSTWGAATALTTTASSELYQQIRLAADPNSDGLVMVVGSSTQDFAYIWSGSAWGNSVVLSSVANQTDVFVAYEQQSGEVLVVYGKSDEKVYYRTWNGSVWSSEASIAAPAGITGRAAWTVLGADPSSNRIALGVVTTGPKVWLNVWDGSSWGTSTQATASGATASALNVGVAFENDSGEALAVYGVSGSNVVRYRTWNGSWSSEQNGPDIGGTPSALFLDPAPVNTTNTDDIILSTTDNGRDVNNVSWNGSSWGTPVEQTTATGRGGSELAQPVLFLWNQNFSAAGTGTTASLSASPTLVSHGGQIQVTLSLSATATITDVTASTPLTMTGTNGAAASCGSPTPATQNVISNTITTFTYTCTVNTSGVTALPASLIFTATATGALGAQFATATSNSVLLAPPLFFQVTIDSPATVDPVVNTAYIKSASLIPATPSDPVQTAIQPSIGDFVWADLDGDGVYDPGEPPLSGVQVCATPTSGGTPICDTTDANGEYRIYGLTPGVDYTVAVTLSSLPTDYHLTTPGSVTVTSGQLAAVNQYYSDADFAARPPGGAAIGDTVWLDADEDGVVDGGETLLPGITVKLYDSAGVNLLATTTTNASGYYTFTGLYAGNYVVSVDESSVVTTSYGVTGTLAGVMDLVSGLNGNIVNPTNPVTVNVPTDSSAVSTADFGYNWSGQIGDLTFYDNNGNGVYDPGSGETPAPLVTQVLYYDADGDGKVSGGDPIVAVVETDGSGFYLVDNLPPGDYVMDPDEQTVESPTTAGLYMTMITSSPETIAFTLGAGAGQSMTDLTVDSGFIEAAVVEGYVFWDENSDGLMGAETGLANISVTLTGTDIGGNPVNVTVDTDPDGEYKFIVAPGTYTINYNTADGDIPAALGTQTTPTSTTFTALAGSEYKGSSFNFGLDNTGSIGNLIWNDGDMDGVGPNGNGAAPGTDNSESGLAAVTVELYDAAGTTLLATTVTTASGGYLFNGLPDGSYVVKVVTSTLPANFAQTYDKNGGGDSRATATVAGGGSDLTLDFGYAYQAVGQSTVNVSGTVFKDSVTTNGVLDPGEPGIAGVQVTMVYTPSGGSPLTAVTTVDANGLYTFTGIAENSAVAIYVIDATLPNAAYVPTSPEPLTLTTSTVNSTGNNFGFIENLGGISGTVCASATGVLGGGPCDDVSDDPLQGVTVTLTYAGVDGILGTGDDSTILTTTSASGVYSFPNLLPGLYQVVETDPVGYISLGDRDGGNANVISPINLAVGQTKAGQDFEDKASLVTIVGGVYEDLDGDGVKDPGEPALVGVKITLSNGLTTTTDSNGVYTFTVAPGAYTMTETNPSGYTSTGDTDGANDDVISVTVNSGSSTGNNFLDVQPVTIVGTVYSDANGTPGFDLNDTILAGVAISLSNGLATTTDANGVYTFTGVLPGSYLITETNPGGYSSTGDVEGANDDVINLTVTSGLDVTGQNFWDQPTGVIGDFVWYDTDGDGLQDSEPGIAGVVISLTLSSGSVVTTTTDASGAYSFTHLAAGLYTVTVGGGLSAGFTPTVGAESQSSPLQVALSDGEIFDTADFGYEAPASYIISKQLVSPGPFRPGESFSYTLRIENDGAAWLTVVPLRDSYDERLLRFDSATATPDDSWSDGQIDWSDVTSDTGDIAPGVTVLITVTMTGLRDTTAAAGGVATNTVQTLNVLADPDGPVGPLGDIVLPPNQSDAEPVVLSGPTAVLLANSSFLAQNGQVTVRWETVSEAGIAGFNLLRTANGNSAQMNDALIPAQNAGQEMGATYDVMDDDVDSGQLYLYTLEILFADGHREEVALGQVRLQVRIFFPLFYTYQ